MPSTCSVSVLHSSLMDYLLRLSHERYSVLASWPDFTKMVSQQSRARLHAPARRPDIQQPSLAC